MANLIDVLGQQAVQQNTADPTAGLKQGLQAGVQLAQAQNQVAMQEQQLQENEAKITEQKGRTLANLYKAAAFADKTLYPSVRRRLEMTASQLGVPVDLMALDDIKKDDARSIALQKTLSDVTSGRVPTDYAQFMAGLGDSPTIFAALDSKITSNAQGQQKLDSEQAKLDQALQIAALRTNTQRDIADQRDATARAKVANGGGAKLTEGQKVVDRTFGKDFAEWEANGGAAQVNKQLDQLSGPLKILESGKGSGGVLDFLPKSVQDYTNRENAAIQDSVSEVVQSSLRATLGAQFTEKEGAGILARAFNPRQSPKENAARVGRLVKSLRSIAESKQAAADYFQENGTLRGFKGKTRFNLEGTQVDVNPENQAPPNAPPPPTPTGTPPPAPQALSEKQKVIVQQAMKLKGADGKPRFKNEEEAIAALHIGGQ
jgi:hypothetical protein